MKELDDPQFRRSSFCADGACVEVALLENGNIALRHSAVRDQPPYLFTSSEWQRFLQGVKAGEFDFPSTALGDGTR